MLRITRRDFLKYCSVAAGALGLSAGTLMKLENAIAKESSQGAVEVIWVDGAACTGCSVSFLNSVFYTTPQDVLINSIDLNFHKTVMAAAGAFYAGAPYIGANALSAAEDTYGAGGYVLVVEGAIQAGKPKNSTQGEFCEVGELTGSASSTTMLKVIRQLASRAAAVLAVGTCASFGGIPASRGNITGARGCTFMANYSGITKKGAFNDSALDNVGGVANATLANVPVINIPGCPPHPDWIVGTLAAILDTNIALSSITLDAYKRPVDYGYRAYQCNAGPCPWRYNNTGTRRYANNALIADPDYEQRYPEGDSRRLGREKYRFDAVGCQGILGCKGRKTKADCSRRRWNSDVAEEYGVNWCVGSRGNCLGCTEPTFPDKVGKFYTFA
ncbi:MAG: twin-arginine translocation signal domain-containing protein [Nitrospira sp.]|nr:twin-arginine translocation signal domain-containing protein [Nitrospira sp.]